MASQDWVDKDFYAILDVSKDASDSDIKKSYRKLARKYHPDQNQGDTAAEQRFKDVSEAYAVLSNQEDREQYDAIQAMGSGARFTAPGASGAGAAGFEDIFSGLFNQGRPSGGRYSTNGFGAGSAYADSGLPPEFEDLFGGAYQQRQAPLSKGSDRVANTTISFAGAMRGTTIGLQEPDGEIIEVRIPAGVKDGQKVRVRGKGAPGPAGSGDLLVTVKVTPHPFFAREGNNVRVHVPVTFAEAALGAKVSVPTLNGETVTVKIPAGTPSGRVLRVKGKGVKTAKTTGDMLVVVDIVTPQKLNTEAKAAVEAFAEATKGENPREDLAQKAKL